MVGCGRCDDWFHGDCVGLSLSQAQQMGEEDKEYVCVKCCAEEDKRTEIDSDILENQSKVEVHCEDKTMEYEKLGLSKHTPTNDKTKYMEDTVKHRVKISKRVSFSTYSENFLWTMRMKFLFRFHCSSVYFPIYFSITMSRFLSKIF